MGSTRRLGTLLWVPDRRKFWRIFSNLHQVVQYESQSIPIISRAQSIVFIILHRDKPNMKMISSTIRITEKEEDPWQVEVSIDNWVHPHWKPTPLAFWLAPSPLEVALDMEVTPARGTWNHYQSLARQTFSLRFPVSIATLEPLNCNIAHQITVTPHAFIYN